MAWLVLNAPDQQSDHVRIGRWIAGKSPFVLEVSAGPVVAHSLTLLP